MFDFIYFRGGIVTIYFTGGIVTVAARGDKHLAAIWLQGDFNLLSAAASGNFNATVYFVVDIKVATIYFLQRNVATSPHSLLHTTTKGGYNPKGAYNQATVYFGRDIWKLRDGM